MVIFQDARRKTERAKAHIREIKACIDRLHTASMATVDVNPQTGGEILIHNFIDISAFDELALPLGDAVHNLNCALDYVWLQTIEKLAPSLMDERAKMPVRKCAKEVEGWLAKSGVQSNSPLFRFIVDTIQPHGGGNEAIWAVHNFDVRDKHRLLIPVLSHGWIADIVVVDQNGERWQGAGSTAEFQRPPYFISFEPGLHVKEKGQLSAEIVVVDRKSGCEMSIPEDLSNYAHAITHVIELFDGFIKAEASS